MAITSDFGSEDSGSIPDAPTKVHTKHLIIIKSGGVKQTSP